ncbi:hypothetical protein DPMN_167602 [Dreissena polymorpha]|uniref:Uncharacterized protein n=1 Tax=Dreissena polymorpha TaxID=45954 RepID=A0A9D4IYX6_DREPO|nr:hypothetical protein DPMN_167602 [Dreissena polymorpha]
MQAGRQAGWLAGRKEGRQTDIQTDQKQYIPDQSIWGHIKMALMVKLGSCGNCKMSKNDANRPSPSLITPVKCVFNNADEFIA